MTAPPCYSGIQLSFPAKGLCRDIKKYFSSLRATLSQTRVSKERTHSIENHTSKHHIPTTLGLLKHIRLPPRMLIISHYDATHLSMENHNEDNVHHWRYRRFAG
tara:strand:+ start:92 stop:403 length:312 start_codon:yes stop_codon:yes gene_type:complete